MSRTEQDRTRPAPDLELPQRQVEVLRAVIQEHVLSGEPVGSVKVARALRSDVSPATVRNVMAELEERGLLQQPHTSAGRVPTDKAYRLHVESVLQRPPRLAAAQAKSIESALSRSRGEVPELLEEASRQLSSLSHQVGLVLSPDLRRILVDRLEFVRLDSGRVMAILVARSGVVHHRMLQADETLDQPELDRIGRYLTDRFCGRTLPEMRELLRRMLNEERAAFDAALARSLELGRQAVELESGEAGLFVEGASNLLDSPEFSELAVLRSVFRTLEEKKILIDLLGRLIDGSGVQVVIGDENPRSDLARCSLVASSYGAKDRVMGTVAVVGPTRMRYARVIGLVDHLARVLTQLLSNPGR